MIVITILIVLVLLPLLAGFAARLFWGTRRAAVPPALLFHSIPTRGSWALSSIDKERFTQLIKSLHNQHWRAVPVGYYTELTKDKAVLPPQTLVLTFDDAYEDVFLNALPVLEHYAFHATIFVISSYIGREADWDIYAAQRHMSVAQIRAAHAAGHEIGSHTVTHANLPYLSTADVLRELKDSRNALEDLIGAAVTSVSFPFGSWNERIWHCARECGYETATVYRGAGRVRERNLIPVQGVYRIDSPETLIAKLSGSRMCLDSLIRSAILPHFAKGSALWMFRQNYSVWRELFDRNVPSKVY